MIRNKIIFIDTGAWFAIADKSDQYHSKATDQLEKCIQKDSTFLTSNLVIHETVMLLARKISKQTAIKFLNTIYSDDKVNVVLNDENLEQKAYAIFKKYTDQDFSITDCVSFAIMKENRIKEAFTFDKHFSIMGFKMI